MKLAFLVDLHWAPRRPLAWPSFSEDELVLLGGDLTHFRSSIEARALLQTLRAPYRAVAGNCDMPELENVLRELGVGLDQRVEDIQGVTLAGLSAGLPFGDTPYERTEEEFERCLEGLGPARIFVTHQPPYRTRCDRLRNGQHVGSRAVRAWIERHQPELVLCGHIHEAAGEDHVGRSRVVNPGPYLAGHWARYDTETGELQGLRRS